MLGFLRAEGGGREGVHQEMRVSCWHDVFPSSPPNTYAQVLGGEGKGKEAGSRKKRLILSVGRGGVDKAVGKVGGLVGS